MKHHQTRAPWLISAACGLMLAGSASLGFAQNTNPTNNFDTSASTTSFALWWGTATMTWDGATDAANDPLSGSVRYEAPFVGAAGEQFMTFFTIANRWQWDFGYLLDATTYTNLSFDLKVDSSSGQRKDNNDFGWLEIGLCTGTSPGTTYLPGRAIPLTATNWTHFDYPLNPTLDKIDQVSGFFIKMWSNGGHTNSLIFNVDNFAITKPTAPVIIPPPTVSLIPAMTKLNCLATGGQYDRQQIKTVAENLSWVGSLEPVTYEFTIKDAPGASRPGYQAHLFLVPNSTDNSPSVDWNAENLLWFHVEQLASGAGQVTLRYKTNRPGGNDMLFNTDPAATNSSGVLIGVGNLGTLQSAQILGNWKMTISQDTNFTVYAPDGSSTNFSITADASALFAGTMRACLGAQPNNASYSGTGFAFDHVKIGTPSSTWVEDDFSTGALDAANWVKNASDNAGVFVVPVDSPYAISWTLPATGFSPQIGTNITPGSTWKSPASTDQIKIGASVRTYLHSSELNANAAYFRMRKPTFYQLQVLMPGETNAPGTLTGKIGTPDPQPVGNVIDVRVLAVSDDWYPITSVTDTVHFESNDSTAFVPADAALVSGAFSGQMFFGSAGNWTVTASDVTDPTKLSNTSSPVNVQ